MDRWFGTPHWWFGASHEDDVTISNLYKSYFDNTCHLSNVEQVILFDQIPRHVERAVGDIGYKHVISYYLQCAISRALELLRHDNMSPSPIDLSFILLPLRHSNKTEYIDLALKVAWGYQAAYQGDPNDLHILRRFLKATYQRIPISYHNDHTTIYYLSLIEPFPLTTKDIFETFRNILDARSKYSQHSFKPKYEHVVFKAIKEYIDTNLDNFRAFVISLSGGVDSMVVSDVFNEVIQSIGSSLIVNVHVNYNNRPSCSKEVAFLKSWCGSIEQPLIVRDIFEINRHDAMQYNLRDLYESYTKRARFNAYRYASTILSDGNNGCSNDFNNVGIVLGHNKDDCFENILTNLAKKKSYENLKGMSDYEFVDGVHLMRPLLQVSKADIYDYAHTYNIPYLEDSTPSWSQRGKIRDKVVPALSEFNKEALNGFFHLHNHLKELESIQQRYVKHLASKFHACDVGYRAQFGIDHGMDATPALWKQVLHELVGGYVSNKALDVFCKGLGAFIRDYDSLDKRYNNEVRQCNIRKDLHIVLAKVSNVDMQMTLLYNKCHLST